MSSDSATDHVDSRLAELTEVLRAAHLDVVRRHVYHDDSGDGTGDLGWLWACAEPRLFPDEEHDLVARYSTADRDWQFTTPDGRIRRAVTAPGAPPPGDAVLDLLAAAPSPPGSPAELRGLPDWVALAASGGATSFVIPFVQAVAGKTADDFHSWLQARLPHRAGATALPPGGQGFVSILDPESDVQLVVPDPIPPEALRKLAAVDRTELRGRTLVWDGNRGEWLRCRRT